MIKGIPGMQDLLNLGKIMSSTIKTSQGRKLYGSTNWHRNCFLKWSETMWVPGHRNFLCLLFLVYGEQASASMTFRASLVAQMVKASACNAGDLGSIPGLGRSPGEGNGNPLQYSCWEIPWTEEPGRLQSMGSHRVGYDSLDLTTTAFLPRPGEWSVSQTR